MPATDRGTAAIAPRRQLAWWKKLVFSLVATVGFFLILEAVLAVVGTRPLLYDEDPYVGFSNVVPLFVERTDEGGNRVMETADNRLHLFNRQQFPARKSPGTYRIFCLGGSTTYGHPYVDSTSFAGWLREFLPAADGSRRWEVVNAGGISYASYRVALLMEELVRYEPDLFIVYCGQNEFLEARTYGAMLATPTPIRDVHSRLAGTRVFSVLQRLLRRDAAPEDAASREARDMLPGEVVAILDRSVGPESYHRADLKIDQVLEHYRYSLQRMIALARGAGADIVFVTPASNLRDFEPFKSEHREDLDLVSRDLWLGLLHQSGEAFDEGRFDDTLSLLDQASAIDDRHARLHFLRGRVLVRLGRDAEAKTAFERAVDEDVCPLRALTPMRGIVMQVAAEQRVPCVDFVAMMEQRSEHGIPGADWFLDHVHPTIEGYRLLALELMNEIETLGDLHPDPSWDAAAVDRVTRQHQARLDSRSHANALRNLAKTLRWAGKFEESSRLSIMAVQGLPGDLEAHMMAGDAFWQQGQLEAAEGEYLLAINVDPNALWPLLQLGSLLLEQGETKAAVNYLERAAKLAEDRADPHFRLANALYLLGDLDGARDQYLETLRLVPDWPDAHKNLALIANARGEMRTAISHFERALKLDPQDAACHCELGWLYSARGDSASARDELSLAVLLDPRLVRAWIGLARVEQSVGNQAQAAEMFQRVLDYDPENEEALANLGQ
ncbi:MAG: tetratricopeptide repeat protein [Pirellulaceae bacterium]|nr:tetratricopeptide repeat protein [Pirellulaceae bacterium]